MGKGPGGRLAVFVFWFCIAYLIVLSFTSRVDGGYPEFNAVNQMRADKGLFSYRYDPAFDLAARSRSAKMAARRRGGHPPGSFRLGSDATNEGVSWGSGNTARPENACYTDGDRLRSAGAACEWSGGRYYCSVVYGDDTGTGWLGHTPTNPSKGVYRPRLRSVGRLRLFRRRR